MKFCTHVQWRSEKFGAVVFDTLNEKVFVTNQTGRDILKSVADALDEAAIVEHLSKEYRGNAEQIRSDVSSFVKELWSNGLLTSDTGVSR